VNHRDPTGRIGDDGDKVAGIVSALMKSDEDLEDELEMCDMSELCRTFDAEYQSGLRMGRVLRRLRDNVPEAKEEYRLGRRFLAFLTVLGMKEARFPQTGRPAAQQAAIDDRDSPENIARARRDAERSIAKDKDLGHGVVYKVPGSGTPSGYDYIGTADDLKQRTESASDGRDRTQAVEVGRYDRRYKQERREAEQDAIDDSGGVGRLDNKRNEIAKRKQNPLTFPPSGLSTARQHGRRR